MLRRGLDIGEMKTWSKSKIFHDPSVADMTVPMIGLYYTKLSLPMAYQSQSLGLLPRHQRGKILSLVSVQSPQTSTVLIIFEASFTLPIVTDINDFMTRCTAGTKTRISQREVSLRHTRLCLASRSCFNFNFKEKVKEKEKEKEKSAMPRPTMENPQDKWQKACRVQISNPPAPT